MNSHSRNKIEIFKDFLEDKEKNPLEMFSLFVTSNPDFKYNITYLTDQIGSFKQSCEVLSKRLNQFENLVEAIRKLTPKELSGYLIFDNVFQYGINTKDDDHLEFINLDLFRFDKLDGDCYIVKFIIGDKNNPGKTETYKIIKKKESDIESNIKEFWILFIMKTNNL